jgi:murein DD-endopeptidase MepM/ murein hydrolase activator NlpD
MQISPTRIAVPAAVLAAVTLVMLDVAPARAAEPGPADVAPTSTALEPDAFAPTFAETPLGENAAQHEPAAQDAQDSDLQEPDAQDAQEFVAPEAPAPSTARDGWSITAPPPPPPPAVRLPVGAAPVSSTFGPRLVQGCAACSRVHQGVDFAPALGTPIVAAHRGTVTQVGTMGGYGVAITVEGVRDGVPTTMVYGHLLTGSPAVHVGQTVTAGQSIARVGNTGVSTGAHLHFEVRRAGVAVDPLPWLAGAR